MMKTHTKKMFAGLVAAGLIPTSAAIAQNEGFALEEVVVTAQKRAQSLQDVPISAQAFTSDAMTKLGADTLGDLGKAAPSLVIGGLGSGSQQQMGLRGVVDFARNVGIDTRMGIYIDGVFQGRSYVSDLPLLGLESVEILRGPQGTLFGKNTVTGAVSMNTKKPTENVEGQLGLEVGSDNRIKGDAYVSGPLTDVLFGSASVSYLESDGYYKNLTLNKDVGDKDQTAVRGQLRYAPENAWEVMLTADYADKNSDRPLAVNAGLKPYRTYQNFVTTDDSETWGTALTINYNFDNDYVLTSLTSYRHAEFQTLADDDYTPYEIIGPDFNEDADQFSQELRIASPVEDKYDWVAGLYYYSNDLDSSRRLNAGEDLYNVVLGPPLDQYASALVGYTAADAQLDTESYAAFIHGNYRFSEKLELTAGLRYTYEEKDVTWEQYNVQADPALAAALEAATGFPATQTPFGLLGAVDYPELKEDRNDDELSPTVGLNYFASDDVMVYGKYSRGFKSGGYNADFMTAGLEYFAHDPETVDSYELGVKSTLLDDALRINAAVFYSEFEDMQVFQRIYSSAGNPAVQLTNAGEATTQGLELETTWIPVDRLQLTLNAVYLDTEYNEFFTVEGDFSGNRLPYAPEWKTYAGAQYIQPLGDAGDLTFNIDYTYTGSQYSEPANSAVDKVDSYDLWNARATYTPGSGNWDLSVWGKNLADEEYQLHSNVNLLQTERVVWGEPRTYGVSFVYHFGG